MIRLVLSFLNTSHLLEFHYNRDCIMSIAMKLPSVDEDEVKRVDYQVKEWKVAVVAVMLLSKTIKVVVLFYWK